MTLNQNTVTVGSRWKDNDGETLEVTSTGCAGLTIRHDDGREYTVRYDYLAYCKPVES